MNNQAIRTITRMITWPFFLYLGCVVLGSFHEAMLIEVNIFKWEKSSRGIFILAYMILLCFIFAMHMAEE